MFGEDPDEANRTASKNRAAPRVRGNRLIRLGK
jgi:hypothetical protein